MLRCEISLCFVSGKDRLNIFWFLSHLFFSIHIIKFWGSFCQLDTKKPKSNKALPPNPKPPIQTARFQKDWFNELYNIKKGIPVSFRFAFNLQKVSPASFVYQHVSTCILEKMHQVKRLKSNAFSVYHEEEWPDWVYCGKGLEEESFGWQKINRLGVGLL